MTSSFHEKTLVEITHLAFFKEEPPAILAYKQLPKPTNNIVMELNNQHGHAFLTRISKVSHKTLTPRYTKAKRSHK